MSLSKPTRDILITSRDKNERLERLLDRVELLEATLLDILCSDIIADRDKPALAGRLNTILQPAPPCPFPPNVIAFPAGGSR